MGMLPRRATKREVLYQAGGSSTLGRGKCLLPPVTRSGENALAQASDPAAGSRSLLRLIRVVTRDTIARTLKGGEGSFGHAQTLCTQRAHRIGLVGLDGFNR